MAAGLSKAFVSQIESGMANPSLASLKRVGNALDIPLAALFEGSPRMATGPSRRTAVDWGEVRVVRQAIAGSAWCGPVAERHRSC